MLRALLVAFAAILVVVGAALFLTYAWPGGITILAAGGIVALALVLERWRYRPTSARPDPAWQQTGERFTGSPGEGTVEVYDDPATGERHYVAGGPKPPRD